MNTTGKEGYWLIVQGLRPGLNDGEEPVVLGAHQLAVHYSLARIRKTAIFYHILIRVLSNDKRFSAELPRNCLNRLIIFLKKTVLGF